MHVVYLHGFASGPRSRKAQYFQDRLKEHGISLESPDLADGKFETLTISGQLRVAAQTIGSEPTVLIGSSLGGYLSALLAAAHPQIERIVMLAPAFRFLECWQTRLGPSALASWEQTNSIPVFHFTDGRERLLEYQFIRDAARYPALPSFTQPALILHGIHDDVVPIGYSVEFARTHPNARLVQVDSDHQMTNVLDTLWQYAREFLLGQPTAKSMLG